MAESLKEQDLKVGQVINGFRVERVQHIDELHSIAYVFTHQKTGARLIHIYNTDPNNLFSAAFRTPVSDSTGVPHILEHSVLGGSKKFPIKDPFQEMLKGSLQTFLNALTYPDKTVYPVSSQVEKDFFNLVDVYCDAVFNPLLTENTFYQEGWHYDVEDLSRPVGIKGIVYNEMKGIYSDFSNYVDRRTISGLFPDTTYANESGGDPEHIPDLTYEQFVDFHRKFYHPSNSYIFLYGNLPSTKTLKFLEENYLGRFSAIEVESQIQPQPLWSEPRTLQIEAPAPKKDDGTATVVLIWIFGSSTDPVTVLTGSILAYYLLGAESSPLKRALIDSGLGEDLDDISGFEADLVQGFFAAGLRKCKPENAQKIRTLIIETLRKQIDNGFNSELLEGSIRQMEFHLREITGGHFPYGLRLAERCYRSWIYGGDPLAHLAFEKPLTFIKEQTSKGRQFFIDLLRNNLLDNNHNLLSTIIASSDMAKRLEEHTERQVEKLTAHFGDREKQHYHSLTQSLMEQQKTPPSPEALASLPKLYKNDLPRQMQKVPTEKMNAGGVTVYAHPVFTAGIAYLDIGFDLCCIPSELIPYVPLYCELLTRCGAGKFTYEQMATRITLATGGIDSSAISRTTVGPDSSLFFKVFFHGKALVSRFDDMLGIFTDLFLSPRLDNKKQIHDILFEERNGLQSSVISSGHFFAMTRASSHLSKSRYIDEQIGGVSQLRFLDALIKENAFDAVISKLQQMHSLIINNRSCVVSLTVDNPSQLIEKTGGFLSALPAAGGEKTGAPIALAPSPEITGVEISSAVNFVAKVWRLDHIDPNTSGLMFLLARNLSTGYLWDKVRVEGGAYGGNASFSVAHPVFSCSSYRDPNLQSTLDHFKKGLEQAAAGIGQDLIDQSIIGAIGRLDMPRTPHSQGYGETIDLLVGLTEDYRQQLRNSVLEATSESLKKTAQNVLDAKESAVSILGSPSAFEKASKAGLQIKRERLFNE